MPAQSNSAINTHTMYSDHPTLIDKLSRDKLIAAKAAQIIHCSPPQAFGIHGEWGSGKTSFLRQLRFYMDGMAEGCEDHDSSNINQGVHQDETVTIWFDAWRYQHEAAPIIALLHEIRRQFATWDRVKNSGEKLATVACRSVLNAFGDITKLLKLETLPSNAKDIQKQGESWEKQHLENRLGTDTVQEFLQQAIETIIDDRKLVIFIDDLDRCSSTAAYRLLEGLKVYLNLNNCVFVIGMNQQIVVDAIAKELTLFDQQNNQSAVRIYAEAYLEKLCASIERLTPPQACENLLLGWINTESHRQNLVLALSDKGDFIRCLPPNPRRIKALANVLNQWLALDRINQLINQQPDTCEHIYHSLVILAYVYQFHSEIFQRWQFTPQFYDQLSQWATKPWQTVSTNNDANDDDSQSVKPWPAYLQCLELPNKVVVNKKSTNAKEVLSSNFPDPYAINIFWVQPLMFYTQLKAIDITPIIAAVTTFKATTTEQS